MAVTDQFTKQPTTMSNVNKPVDNRMPIQKEFAAINNAVNSVGDTIQSGVDYTMDNMVVPAVTSTYQGTVGKVVGNVHRGISEAKATEADRAKSQNEWTLGGNNYWFGDNNQQGQLNALVGSGHVAGLDLNKVPTLQEQGEGKNASAITPTRGNIAMPGQTTPTAQTPTVGTGVSGNKPATQKTQTTQNTQQPQEQSTPEDSDAFFGGNYIKDQQAKQQQDAMNAYKESAIQTMESDLNQSTAGTIYGKVGADADGIVNTLADANSVYQDAAQGRINMVKSIISQDPANIATLVSMGANPYSDMAMRDVMQYAPEFYKQIQEEVKKIQASEKANAISTGGDGPDVTGTATNNTNTGVDSWAKGISSSPQQTANNITNLSNTMANNQVANTATQEMLSINKQIAEYNEKLNNLEKEARSAFKGDVPQYIVNAYVSNRRQQYQSEINKLESRYNSALDLYKTELNNAQWQQEMNLKYLQYQQGVSNDAWTRYYQSQQLKQNAVKWVDGKAFQVNGDGTITQLNDATARLQYDTGVQSALQGYMSIYTSGGATKTHNGYKYNVSGGQCESFTDNFTEATTGLRMEGAGGRGWTTAEEKVGYINSYVPEVGSVAVAVGGAYDSKYGHTMLVTGYDPSTGIVDLLWSNKDGDEMVYSTSAPLSTLQANGLRGFWNPYMDMVSQGASAGNYMYQGFNTPMANAFERISADSSLSATQRGILPNVIESYDTLYELVNNGQLDTLVQNGDLALIMKDIKNQKFSNNDGGDGFISAFSKALNNKVNKLAGGDDSYLALLSLQRLVEAKLRKESGAAISSSEWLSNFSILLPQAGESNIVKQKKMEVWDRIISTNFISAGGKMSEYIPIFQNTAVRNIRAN